MQTLTNFLPYLPVPAYTFFFFFSFEAQTNQRHSMCVCWEEEMHHCCELCCSQELEMVVQVPYVPDFCRVPGCLSWRVPCSSGLGGVWYFIPCVWTECLSQLTLACRVSLWSCSWLLYSEGKAHLGIVLSPWIVWKSLNPKYNLKCVETFERGYTSLRNTWYTLSYITVWS